MAAAGLPAERERDEEQEEQRYRGLVNGAKAAAAAGDLEEALRLFRLAATIRPSEKLLGRMRRVEEVLEAARREEQREEEEEEDEFLDVCGSGLLIYSKMYWKLFQHQREGIAFLYRLHREGRPGGILADDMGLGKTIQVIAFLSGMFDAELIQHVLIIMPTTLVSSWLAEFARWTPGLRVKEFHGSSKAERTRNLERVQRRNGIVITSYQMLINNWKQLASSQEQEFVWDYVILDEAHKIKCASNKTTKCVYMIPARHRLLLTGTPVQNNLQEMWSLFDFACQGALLGTAKTFKMEYENPITRAREKDATLGEKALGLKMSENLMAIIKPYFLRRTKDDIKNNQPDKADTPPAEGPSDTSAPLMPSLTRKNDFVVWVYLAPVQEEIYRNFLSLDHVKEVLMTTRSPLAELNVLKKLCDHPRLLSARACVQLGLETQEDLEQDPRRDLGTFSSTNKIDHLSEETLIQESGKMLFLVGLLERLREEGHRTLVFSQSRKMLDILEHVLSGRGFGITRIDGTVTQLTERERRINAFQSSSRCSVFLLTTQVGGVGITLTAASRVVIFDPSWNPATDAQAVDRAYRIGQKENVVIYRLITCGTVEEKIYRRQVFKDSIIRQTTGDKKNPFRYFSKQELRELFTLEDTRTSTTQIQLQSLHSSQRQSDVQLDEHIAYLHSLEMFGISDHDLIYTREMAQEEEEQVESEEAHQYIQRRVQKAHELVQLESQLRDLRMEEIRNTCEETWQRPRESVSEPKEPSPGLDNPQQFVSPPAAAEEETDNVIDLTESKEVVNVSSKMTTLTIDDVDEENLPGVASIVDAEPLNTSKAGKHPHTRESEPHLDSSVVPTSPPHHPLDKQSLAEKQHSHGSSDSLAGAGESLAEAGESLAEAGESLAGAGESLAGAGESLAGAGESLAGAEESLAGAGESLAGAGESLAGAGESLAGAGESLAGAGESLAGAGESLAGAGESLAGHHQRSSNKPGVADSPRGDTREWHRAPDPHASLGTEQDATPKPALAAAAPHLSNILTEIHSGLKSGMSEGSLREMTVPSFQDQVDFNLVLEESEVDCQDASAGEEHEHPEKEGCQLKAEGFGDSPTRSWVGEKSCYQADEGLNESQGSRATEDSSIVFASCRKKGLKRIVSESEDEQGSIMILGETQPQKQPFPLSSPSHQFPEGISTSTPKHDCVAKNILYPPLASSGSSSASRRSLINQVAEEVEDIGEMMGTTEEDDGSEEEEEEEQDHLVEEEAEECSGESAEPEEEPAGETLDSSWGSLHLDSSSEQNGAESPQSESPQEESTGDAELQPGEQVDYFTQEGVPPREAARSPAAATGDYSTLVDSGKQLQDQGKLQEALDCFLQALDIRGGDPEVMLMTLNLYRQLAQK